MRNQTDRRNSCGRPNIRQIVDLVLAPCPSCRRAPIALSMCFVCLWCLCCCVYRVAGVCGLRGRPCAERKWRWGIGARASWYHSWNSKHYD